MTAHLQSGVDADMKNVSDRTTSISRIMMCVARYSTRQATRLLVALALMRNMSISSIVCLPFQGC